MTNSMVAHNWAHGRRGRGSNLETDGVTLTSYYTTIAARIGAMIYISADNMSPTTSKHLGYARRAVNHERDRIFYTRAFCYGTYFYGSDLTHAAMLIPEAIAIISDLENVLASNARQKTKISAIDAYNQARERIQALAKRLKVKLPKFPKIEADQAEIDRYRATKLKAEITAEKKRQAEYKRRAQEQAEQFRAWVETGAGQCPSVFTRNRYETGDYLTVRGDMVITSQGAEAPLEHVIRALRFYDSRKQADGTYQPYQTNGHTIHLGNFKLDRITGDGTVYAGCHFFKAEEIQRFRARHAAALKEGKE